MNFFASDLCNNPEELQRDSKGPSMQEGLLGFQSMSLGLQRYGFCCEISYTKPPTTHDSKFPLVMFEICIEPMDFLNFISNKNSRIDLNTWRQLKTLFH